MGRCLVALAFTIGAALAESERSHASLTRTRLGRHARGDLAADRIIASAPRSSTTRAFARFHGGGGDWRELAASVPPKMLLFSSGMGAFVGAMRGGVEQMDLVGCTLLGVIAGVGGGTLRDLVLGIPVYWTYMQVHLYTCAATALATFLLLPYAKPLGMNLLVLYADAAALASGAIIGAYIGHGRSGDPGVTLAVGAVTALSGGVIVDMICMKRPRVFDADRSMYAAPALLGAAAYAALIRTDLQQSSVVITSFLMAVGLRALAWTYCLRLPRWTAAAPPPGVGFDLFGSASGNAGNTGHREQKAAFTTRATDDNTQ